MAYGSRIGVVLSFVVSWGTIRGVSSAVWGLTELVQREEGKVMLQ